MPIRFVRQWTPSNLLAPCYHLVSDDPPAHVRHLYRCRNVREFKDDLDWLLRRFKPLTLQDVNDCVTAHRPVPEGSLFLSFDDGLRECAEVVAPICRAKGVPVTFFLSTAFLGNRALCYRHKASVLIDRYRTPPSAKANQTGGMFPHSAPEFRSFVLGVRYRDAHLLDECAQQLDVDFESYLSASRPYLDEADVTALLGEGFSIGGHSVDHPPYAEIPLEGQLAQTSECVGYLQSRFQPTVASFAFPFVADGVPQQFIDQAFSSKLVDLMFYTGALRHNCEGRLIWRFGVESSGPRLDAAWRKEIGTQQFNRVLERIHPVLTNP
jgi:peptidoglycan/xylan/chitin deacetylase (PgdA/CDA1 family)